MVNKVVVKIFGDEYPITGADDTARISRVADALDARMRAVAKRSRSQAKDRVAILTALSLASELQEKADRLAHFEGGQDDRLDGLLARLDEALKGTAILPV